MRHPLRGALTLVLLLLVSSGCNALGITDVDGTEVTITVQALGADYIDGDDGFRYNVTSSTGFDDGVDGFADVTVGRRIEIEYLETSTPNVRTAVKISADDGKSG